jgi:hypothetical protein
MKKQKLILISIILIVIIILINFFIKDEPTRIKEKVVVKTKVIESIPDKTKKPVTTININKSTTPQKAKVLDCNDLIKNKQESREDLWSNFHIELPNGTVQRVRIFNADGENASYRKLVLFEENEDGFPVKIKLANSESINPTPETISKYKNRGKIIYKEEAISFKLRDKREIFEQKVDDKIKEQYIQGPQGRIDCLASEVEE